MKKTFGRRIPGILITIVLGAAMALFVLGLAETKLLPAKYLLLAGGILFVLLVLVHLMTRDAKRIGKMITGCILAVLILIALFLGTGYLTKAVDTLNNLTRVKVEVTDVGIYVRQDDPAESVADTTGYRFGMMAELDRENSNTVMEKLEADLQTGLNVTEFDGLPGLIDGLLTTKQVDAIILNSAYLDLLGDMEGYEETGEQLRQLHNQRVEQQVQITTEPVPKEPEATEPVEEDISSEAFVAYISGIDSRTGLIAKSRSDVNILAVVNPGTHQVLLVSTPRDYYVPLPISDGIPDKLTHAGIYGIDVSIGTLEMLYGIDVDYYFRVNFSGFEGIVDALGGVTVHSDYDFSAGGYAYREGENTLNGAQALTFARERYSFASGDRQRGKNQMAVIRGVIDKAMSPAILTNYTSIMESVSGCFETSIPYDKVAELVRNQLDEGGSWNVVSCSVDGTGATKRPYSMSANAYVMIPDQSTVDAAIEKINQVLNGEIPQ